MKKTLVTGGSGFIGRHTLPLLVKANHEVHAVSFREQHADKNGIHWHKADLKDGSRLKELVAEVQPTHLLHLAWTTEPGKYWNDPENIRWVQASLELLQAFSAQNGERVVMAGTCAEYDWSGGVCAEKTTPLKPTTLYGNCKRALQIMVESFGQATQLSTSWCRIFHVYGPHEHKKRLVPSVICSLLQGKPAECSHGQQNRDLLYVEDVASGIVSLLESNVTGAVNIGAGKGVMLKDVIEMIGNKVGRPDLIRLGWIPSPSDEPSLLVADTRRVREEVNWDPRFNLDTGLDHTIQWWADHLGIKPPNR